MAAEEPADEGRSCRDEQESESQLWRCRWTVCLSLQLARDSDLSNAVLSFASLERVRNALHESRVFHAHEQGRGCSLRGGCVTSVVHGVQGQNGYAASRDRGGSRQRAVVLHGDRRGSVLAGRVSECESSELIAVSCSLRLLSRSVAGCICQSECVAHVLSLLVARSHRQRWRLRGQRRMHCGSR